MLNPGNATASFSKREKVRRNPCNRRGNRSISLRRLCISQSCTQGSTRIRSGCAAGSCPSANASCRVSSPSCAGSMMSEGHRANSAAYALPGRRGPVPARAGPRRRFEHPPQPYESWRSSRRGSGRRIGGAFLRARPVGMSLDDGVVQRRRLELDAQDPLSLPVRQHLVQHPVPRPAVHPGVDGAPIAKPRHAQPGPATYRMALRTRRFARLTLPRRTGRRGAMRSYRAWVSSSAEDGVTMPISVATP